MANGSTQAQRDYITSLVGRIGVPEALAAGAITTDMAINSGGQGGFRTARDVARHCSSKATASKVITALKEM